MKITFFNGIKKLASVIHGNDNQREVPHLISVYDVHGSDGRSEKQMPYTLYLCRGIMEEIGRHDDGQNYYTDICRRVVFEFYNHALRQPLLEDKEALSYIKSKLIFAESADALLINYKEIPYTSKAIVDIDTAECILMNLGLGWCRFTANSPSWFDAFLSRHST